MQGWSLPEHKGWCCIACAFLSSAFLYSSLTNTSMGKKGSSMIIHSVINFVVYSINIHWESTVCQVHRAIAPIHLHKTGLVLFWLQTSPGVKRGPHLCLSKSFPFHKTQGEFIFTFSDPWVLLHELILNSFLLCGLQYHLCLTIYMTFNINTSVHTTNKIPSVRAL